MSGNEIKWEGKGGGEGKRTKTEDDRKRHK